MSFKALSWAWDANTETAGRKLVLVGLAQFANEKNECWPSQKTLAERTLQSERTVREHLSWLEDAGFIRRSHRGREGCYETDRIVLNLSRLHPIQAETQRQISPTADFADGEKPHVPAADFAGGQRQISPPNLQDESPDRTTTPYSPPVAVDRVEKEVEEIYAAYPLKVGKGQALKAIRAALKIAGFEELLAATQAFADAVATVPESRRRFIKHPSTWFNGQCWLDDRSTWVLGADPSKSVSPQWNGFSNHRYTQSERKDKNGLPLF